MSDQDGKTKFAGGGVRGLGVRVPLLVDGAGDADLETLSVTFFWGTGLPPIVSFFPGSGGGSGVMDEDFAVPGIVLIDATLAGEDAIECAGVDWMER